MYTMNVSATRHVRTLFASQPVASRSISTSINSFINTGYSTLHKKKPHSSPNLSRFSCHPRSTPLYNLQFAQSPSISARSSSSHSTNDTIYALASGSGRSALAVIRLSGPNAWKAAELLCSKTSSKKHLPKPRCSAVRSLYHPLSGEQIDQALVLPFAGPNSFTGEDVVELHVHGGRAVVTDILDALSSIEISQRRLRVAEPGEFTRRAFENQKLDLTNVEGLADLIAADTSAQRRQALRQLSGELGKRVEKWRTEIIGCLAHMTGYIDFGDDEEIPKSTYDFIVPRILALSHEITACLNDQRRGERLRDGLQIAIVGPPNAGKSSLLNLIAQRDVAIVSEIAGTTRDVVEVHLNLAGFPVVIADTAGIRETSDPIEKEGIKRSVARMKEAAVRVVVVDVEDVVKEASLVVQEQRPLLDGIIQQTVQKIHDIQQLQKQDLKEVEITLAIVLNKADTLPRLLGEEDYTSWLTKYCSALTASLQEHITGTPHVFPLSCHTSNGLDVLLQWLSTAASQGLGDESAAESAVITRARHRSHLAECVRLLESFIQHDQQVDISSEYLRQAAQELSFLTGRIDLEEVLDVVFRDFCIGK